MQRPFGRQRKAANKLLPVDRLHTYNHLSKIVVHNRILLHTQTVEIVGDRLNEHGRTAKIIFAVFGRFVILQIGVANAIHGKPSIIFHTGGIGLRVGLV